MGASLALQPCQSSYCYCQEVLDRLIQCGLLVAEEVGRGLWTEAPAWARLLPLPLWGGGGQLRPQLNRCLGPAATTLHLGVCHHTCTGHVRTCTDGLLHTPCPPHLLSTGAVALEGRCS